MDTKHLEQIGETFIVSSLLDAGILVAKPFFDRLGTDLVGFSSIDDKAKFCRIQCKYRELKKSTSVEIDSKYIVGAFILFLYIKASDKRHFYCLLPKDIKRIFLQNVTKKKKTFRLSITRKSLMSLEKDKSINFTQDKVLAISALMKSSSPDAEFRRMVSGLVQTTKKLTKTQREYSELKQLIHKIEIANLKKEACEEKLKILKEYHDFMEEQYEGQCPNK